MEPRLSAEEVVLESGERVSRARLTVQLGSDFGPRQARERFHAGLRVVVRTDERVPGARHMLFDGTVAELDWSWSSDAESTGRMSLVALGSGHGLTGQPGTGVFGRAVRSLEIERGLSSDSSRWESRSRHISALRCLFNANGRGNRSAEYLRVVSVGGQILRVPVFVDDGSVEGREWNFGEVLRYLVWFHLPTEGPVGAGNVWEITQFLDAPGSAVPFGRALLECPRDLMCEATNLLEALTLVTARAGLRFHVETVNASGLALSQLRVWDSSSGGQRHVRMGSKVWDPKAVADVAGANESFDSFLERNNTHRGRSSWRRVTWVTSPMVIGGVKKYEISAELVPGWVPVGELDNVASGNVAAMKALALTEEVVRAGGPEVTGSDWYRRFHRRGDDFASYALVARAWVLNESGEYGGATYNRNAPFDSYSAFDLASAIGADVTDAGRWMRRRRRLLPFEESGEGKDGEGVVVEVSFDSGQSWWEPGCEIKVMADRCGIRLGCSNPTELGAPGTDPAEQNMWFSLIDGTFRVRIRALVESDERIVVSGRVMGAGDSGAVARTMLVYRPDDYGFVRSNEVMVDDTESARNLADRLAGRLAGEDRGTIAAAPWLERSFGIGDVVVDALGIGGSGARAVVLSKRYVLSADGVETELIGGPMSAEAEVL